MDLWATFVEQANIASEEPRYREESTINQAEVNIINQNRDLHHHHEINLNQNHNILQHQQQQQIKKKKKKIKYLDKSKKTINTPGSKHHVPTVPNCQHTRKSKLLKCNELNINDVNHFYRMFCENHTKSQQDTFVLLYSHSNPVQKSRVTAAEGSKPRNLRTNSTTYYVRKADNKMIKVCKAAFETILGLQKNRVTSVVRQHFTSGELPHDTPAEKKQEDQRHSVMEFIDRYITTVNTDHQVTMAQPGTSNMQVHHMPGNPLPAVDHIHGQFPGHMPPVEPMSALIEPQHNLHQNLHPSLNAGVPKQKEKKKRIRNPDNWKRNKAKTVLYSAKDRPSIPDCQHGDKSKTYKCKLLNQGDADHFHRMFYENRTKLDQDTFILLYSYSNLVNRKRPKDNSRSSRTVSTTYHVRRANNRVVQVCKTTFETILCVSKSRVSNVVKRHFVSGELPRETRGGNRQTEKYEALRRSVRGFIDRFPVSINTADKDQPRHVLPPDLNVQKMLKLYNDEMPENLKVKKDFFYKIFNSEYNLGFANPKEKQPCHSMYENHYQSHV